MHRHHQYGWYLFYAVSSYRKRTENNFTNIQLQIYFMTFQTPCQRVKYKKKLIVRRRRNKEGLNTVTHTIWPEKIIINIFYYFSE